MTNPFTELFTKAAQKRRPQTVAAKSVRPGFQETGARANSTPMQRVLSGALPSFNGLQRRILVQRSPTSRPLNIRTRTTSNRTANMTLAPGSVPARRTIGVFTGVAARGQSVGASPHYVPNRAKPLGIKNNSLQRFGVSTIQVPVVSPPQGGGVPGFRALMARGKGHPVKVAAAKG